MKPLAKEEEDTYKLIVSLYKRYCMYLSRSNIDGLLKIVSVLDTMFEYKVSLIRGRDALIISIDKFFSTKFFEYHERKFNNG